ncbi:hypothetical protein DB29_02419 [Shouchella clausii]|nr:hypothetical protein DB29_02419 [Shouchella clausii]
MARFFGRKENGTLTFEMHFLAVKGANRKADVEIGEQTRSP